jgi:tRNA-Thr(GGU) m(6)t(6)A37 methyltransferase TsaA
MPYTMEPVAFVTAVRANPEDDFWGGEVAAMTLIDSIDESALHGLETFSHVEVIFVFNQVSDDKVVLGARHPRNNEVWPKVGIFAQRAKGRPNRMGSTICKLIAVEGRTLKVRELDAIDGTPVLDIKPVIKEFLPREPTHQPSWVTELMSSYWNQR